MLFAKSPMYGSRSEEKGTFFKKRVHFVKVAKVPSKNIMKNTIYLRGREFNSGNTNYEFTSLWRNSKREGTLASMN